MTLLSARGVTVVRGRRTVLHDVDLSVSAGDVVAVLGPNGAGKSTLLSVLSGVLPASSGTVEAHGRVAAAQQSPDLARRSVRANVEIALSWWGVPKREQRSRALEALRLMRAEDLAARPTGELSGGERRRVHLARALALRPDVLLLDEPFAGLDPQARSALLEDTATAISGSGQAAVVVVHDRAEAWAVASRLLVLLDGRVAATGPPEDVLDAPPSAEVARFLGFTGSLQTKDGELLLRPAHVHLDAAGSLVGTVQRRVPEEDAVLLEVSTAQGSVQLRAPYPAAALDARVRLSLSGGVTYP